MRRIMFALNGGLLLFAAVYWGILTSDNAPFVYHPDEPDVVGRAVRMILTGDLNPHWFHYPTLLFYLDAFILKVVNLVIGLPFDQGLSIGVRGVDPHAFVIYHVARLVTVAFSVGTLFLLLRLASRFTSPLLASLAGLTFIGSPIVLESARYVTVDMPTTFFVLASLTMMVNFADSAESGQPRERYYWYAVVLGGLAAGTKYNGAAVLFLAPLLLRLAKLPLRRSLYLLLLGGLLSVAVFLATTPYALLDAKTFLDLHKGMLYDFRHYSSGHPGADQGIAFVKMIRDLFLEHSVLTVLVLCAPAGLFAGKIRKSFLLVCISLVLFLGMVGVAKVYFSRNILVAIPLVDCSIACGVQAVTDWDLFGKMKRRRTFATAFLGIVFLAAGLTSLLAVHGALREEGRTDNRTAAYEWITTHLPEGARILYEAYCPQLYYTRQFAAGYAWTIAEVPFEDIVKSYDFVVISENQWERYQSFDYQSYRRVFELPLVKKWPDKPGEMRGPEIRLYSTDGPSAEQIDSAGKTSSP